VQGLQRYYALLIKAPHQVQLIKRYDGQETVLETQAFPWEFEQEIQVALEAVGDRLKAWVNGSLVFDRVDASRPLLDGAIALIAEEGHLCVTQVEVKPITA
jgi:hypothetical protein